MAEIAAKDAVKPKKEYKIKLKPRQPPERIASLKCCLDKHDDLPKSFKMCIDCPKRNGDETSTV